PKVESPEIPVKEELPEYPITKVDTTGWEYRETKLADVGIRYKVPSSVNLGLLINDKNYDKFSLTKYSLPDLYGTGIENQERLGKGYDGFNVVACLACDAVPVSNVSIDIVETSDLNLKDIENLVITETCEYKIRELGEDEINYVRYIAEPQCKKEQRLKGYNWSSQTRTLQSLNEIIRLRVSGENITQYKNSFVSNSNSVSNLVQYPVVAAYGVNEETKTLKLDNQLLFIIDLGNDKFAIITNTLQLTYAYSVQQKINNLMHTILSTIEVL
ncbi:MAG: hypothetical protein WD512_17635, partial [Candidatus Paceibacterota bacterium]